LGLGQSLGPHFSLQVLAGTGKEDHKIQMSRAMITKTPTIVQIRLEPRMFRSFR